MNRQMTVDDIIKNTSDEDDAFGGSNLNIDDILNEYGGNSTDIMSSNNQNKSSTPSTRFEFSSDKDRSKSITNIQDEELRKIIEEADNIYKDDMNDDGLSNYIDNLNLNDLIYDRRQSTSRPVILKEEPIHYKNSIDFINYMETVYIKAKLESN
jgi:hypothetical protein